MNNRLIRIISIVLLAGQIAACGRSSDDRSRTDGGSVAREISQPETELANTVGLQAPPDNLQCLGQYGKISTATVRSQPYASADVERRSTRNLCLNMPSSATVLGMECTRQENIFGKYPAWRCPLDGNCFGDGVFRNAVRKMDAATGDDQVCVEFVNSSSRYSQSAIINFQVFVP